MMPDHSSDVAIVEPVDQAAAVIPCAADLLAASDFTPHLLNDMHAPIVTVILEEQTLAPARVLARVPYLKHLLGLVQQGCEPAQLPVACASALVRAHADLATHLPTHLAGLFDRARLAALSHWLTINSWETPRFWPAHSLLRSTTLPTWLPTCRPTPTPRQWHPATANCVLLAQPAQEHEASHPVVSCLSSGCALPAAIHSCSVEVYVPAHPSELLCGLVHGSTPLWAPPYGCAHLRISPQLLEHTQILELRAIVQIRVPLAATPEGTALPKQPVTAHTLLQAGWRPDLVLQMPRERDQPALAELPVSLQQPQAIQPPSASPLLADDDPSGSIKHYFLRGAPCSQPRAPSALSQPRTLCLLLGTTP